jgi:hypothetical protein
MYVYTTGFGKDSDYKSLALAFTAAAASADIHVTPSSDPHGHVDPELLLLEEMALPGVSDKFKGQPLALKRAPHAPGLRHMTTLIVGTMEDQHRRHDRLARLLAPLHDVVEQPQRACRAVARVIAGHVPDDAAFVDRGLVRAGQVTGQGHGIDVTDAGAGDTGLELPSMPVRAIAHRAQKTQEAAVAPSADDQPVLVRVALHNHILRCGDHVGVFIDAGSADGPGGEPLAAPAAAAVVCYQNAVPQRQQIWREVVVVGIGSRRR